jgi:hypothetical protein
VSVLAVLAVAVVAATTGVVVWALTSDDGHDRPAAAEPRSDAVPRPSFDGEGLGTETLAEMAIITGDPVPGVDLAAAESVMRDNALAAGGEVVGSGHLDTELGAWAWHETILGEDVGATDLRLVEYVIVLDEQVWHITFWSDELPSERATADAIVESFRPR